MNVAKIMIMQIIKKLEKRYNIEIKELYFELNFLNNNMTVEIENICETKEIRPDDLDSTDIFLSLIHKKMKEQKMTTNNITPNLIAIKLILKPEMSDETMYYYENNEQKLFIQLKNVLI